MESDSQPTASPTPRPKSRPVQSPQQNNARDLILLWCLWLLGSWTVAFDAAPIQPAAQWMIFACMTGLLILWPALRLSQELDVQAMTSQILWDWLCLNLVFQAVVWPLQISAHWSMTQTMWIDATIATWSLFTGLILVIAGRWSTGPGRIAAMGVCLAVLVAEPVLMTLSPVAWTMVVSPIDVLRELVAGTADQAPPRVIAIATIAVIGWAVFGVNHRARL